jgi:hypothetical protein
VYQAGFPILFLNEPPWACRCAWRPEEKEDRLMSQLSSPVEIYWISGSPFAWRVLLKLLLRASRRPEAAPLELGLDDFETRFPGVAAWMQRVEQLPGYEKTYAPHWRQA